MENRTFYNEILTEHNIHPMHKTKMIEPQKSLRGVNPSCGDDITLQLNVSDDGIIEDGAFFGDGCAISQASADMMLELVIGKSVEESLKLKDTFLKMIKDKITDEELEMLEEAGSLKDISHMPSRVKCAVLGWRTLEQMLAADDEASSEVSTETE
ncbi:MAG: SUF system NifU family Fe-S cluster assembly protein [Eubacterium sp.]|nr:SUF system NifU family Fe-S cluster assembly protein [Eubacterium sp.]